MKQRTFFTFFMICITPFNNSFSQEWFQKGKNTLYSHGKNIYEASKRFNSQQLFRYLRYYARGRSAFGAATLIATNSSLVKEKLEQAQQAAIKKASEKLVNNVASSLDEASKVSKQRNKEFEQRRNEQRMKNELELKLSEERNIIAKQERQEREAKQEKINALQLNYEKQQALKEQAQKQKERQRQQESSKKALEEARKRNEARRQRLETFEKKFRYK